MQGDNLGQQLSLYQDLRVRPGLNIDVHSTHNPSNEIDVREHLKSFPPGACKIRHIAENIINSVNPAQANQNFSSN